MVYGLGGEFWYSLDVQSHEWVIELNRNLALRGTVFYILQCSTRLTISVLVFLRSIFLQFGELEDA
jgi:hypothetical protein